MQLNRIGKKAFLIAYIEERGWTIAELSKPVTESTMYSPEEFENKYGHLPPNPIPPNANKFLRDKLPEYYAHQNQNQKTPNHKSGQGFGKE